MSDSNAIRKVSWYFSQISEYFQISYLYNIDYSFSNISYTLFYYWLHVSNIDYTFFINDYTFPNINYTFSSIDYT